MHLLNNLINAYHISIFDSLFVYFRVLVIVINFPKDKININNNKCANLYHL